MRKLLPVIAAATLVTLAGAAHAERMVTSGNIHGIDLTRNTFLVGDTAFQWSSSNSGGVKLSKLKDGQAVRVVYDHNNQSGRNNVMELELAK